MAEQHRNLSVADMVATLALIGGSLTAGLPVMAATRALTLLFALGGALFLCHNLFTPRWKKWLGSIVAITAYIVVVLLLFEQEAKAAKVAAPTTTFLLTAVNVLGGVPWWWILATAVLTAAIVLLIVRQRPATASREPRHFAEVVNERVAGIAERDKSSIKKLVRVAGISYHRNFEKAYAEFVISVFNISIYDIVIDNKIKSGAIRFGEDWEPFHYEPKIVSAEPIECKARSGTYFAIRQPVRFEEIERLKANEYIIGFYDLHIDFRGSENFPEIDDTRLDLTQLYLETRKGVLRFLDRLEQIFAFSDEQWAALKNQDEIAALQNQVKALQARAQKFGLRFEIDDKQTQVDVRGHTPDSSIFAVKVRLRCTMVGDSKLAIREFSAALFALSEDGEVPILDYGSAIVYTEPGMELVKNESGWLINEPLTPYRWYYFFFDIKDATASLLTTDAHFVRVTMDAVGQNPQHIDFFVNSWEDAFKSNSGITLRRPMSKS